LLIIPSVIISCILIPDFINMFYFDFFFILNGLLFIIGIPLCIICIIMDWNKDINKKIILLCIMFQINYILVFYIIPKYGPHIM